MKTPILIQCAVISLPVSLQAAVSLPYSTDFSDSTTNATQPLGWDTATTSGAGAGTAITATKEYRMNTNGAGSALTLFTPDPVISTAVGSGFRLTASFNLATGAGQFENTAIYFLATGSGSSRLIINGGYAGNGVLEFSQVGGATSNGTLTGFSGLETAGALFTVDMTGIFQTGGSMLLTATLSNDQNADTATSTATLNAAAGTKFGIRTAAGGLDSPTSLATYHAFSLEQIPEPTTAMLALAGLVAALSVRGRVS